MHISSLNDVVHLWAQKAGNGGRPISNKELCKELGELAEKEDIVFRYKGRERAFAQRMANLRANLREFFEIGEITAGKRKMLFSYTLKPEDEEK